MTQAQLDTCYLALVIARTQLKANAAILTSLGFHDSSAAMVKQERDCETVFHLIKEGAIVATETTQ